jgi:choline kinase
MLDWILEALAEGGFRRRDVVFICGYAEEAVRSRYPDFTYVRNAGWAGNNILLSLMTAREHLQEGFISTYADIVYEGAIVKQLVESPHALTLGCDTAWRRRYVDRSQHPETDAEKLRAEGTRVVEMSRRIPSEQATGEFIGVMKASAAGAAELLSAFDEARAVHAGTVWREGRTFEKAYLLDLLQHMLEGGTEMHRVDTPGGYMELDTLEDLAAAEKWWQDR